MSFRDKASLLLADHTRRCETKGKDYLLTTDENDAIVKDLQDKMQVKQLNRIVDLYNISGLAVCDVTIRRLNLELITSRLDTFVVAMVGWGTARDGLSDLLHSAKKKKGKAAQQIALEIQESRKKVPSQFRLFSPADPEDDDFDTQIDHYKTREPNVLFQGVFVRAIEYYKELTKALYLIEYMEREAGFRLLGDDDMDSIHRAEKQLRSFEELEGFLKIIEVYKSFYETNMVKKDGFTEPEFEKVMTDFSQILELSEEEKEEMEQMIKRNQELRKMKW